MFEEHWVIVQWTLGVRLGFFKAEKREAVGGILGESVRAYYRAAQGLEPFYRLLVAVTH